MKGSIHSDQTCPVCGARFKSLEPRGMFCPNHPNQSPQKMAVRYGKITKRFDNYPAALQFLTGLRFKAKPLSFDRLAEEWLELKAGQIKRSSLWSIQSGIARARKVWGQCNIKNIQYPQIEDFIKSYPGAPKTRANILAALKQLFTWAHDRYDVPEIKRWPKLGHIEMSFRNTVDLETQEAIISDIKEHEPFRVWLCIKWLATYIAIRPSEMRGLTESQVDRQRGILIIPHPKEKRSKLIPLIAEDVDFIRALPYAFDQNMPFFRHDKAHNNAKAGQRIGHGVIYDAWLKACGRLGVEGVSLYPGTKHSTAMGLRSVATPEEIKSMTLHSTSQAFNRYFQTGGEDLRNLLSRRKSLVDNDNGLITKVSRSSRK